MKKMIFALALCGLAIGCTPRDNQVVEETTVQTETAPAADQAGTTMDNTDDAVIKGKKSTDEEDEEARRRREQQNAPAETTTEPIN